MSKVKKIAFAFGAGSCKGSWNPVLRALKDYYKPNFKPSPDSANSLFASCVHNLRESLRIQDDELHQIQLSNLKRIKSRIIESFEIEKQTKSIALRAEFKESVSAIKECCNDIYAITTNWDAEADDILDNNVKHLHGSATAKEDLYLPTETAFETYRTDLENESFERNHFEAQNQLAEVDALVVYGLSFSPLDAELQRVFWKCFNGPKLNRMLFIDPNGFDVIRRINFCFVDPSQNLETLAINPEESISIRDQIINALK